MQELINQVLQGDCLEVLKTFPDNYFDSLVTDPPAGISFMGTDFDKDKGGMLNWINWLSEIMNEAMRTMKPGALGLVWSIPRTSHWTGMALELAGFRLIDVIHVASGQGFPKGQDVGRLIDQCLNAKREVVKGTKKPIEYSGKFDNRSSDERIKTAPFTPEAKHWDGWKSPALKPSVEGWWLVQKNVSESSIARNILKHGVGGINVEACRIGTEDNLNGGAYSGGVRPASAMGCTGEVGGTSSFLEAGGGRLPPSSFSAPTGRYPANLVLSCGDSCEGENHSPDCPVTLFPESKGQQGEIKGTEKNRSGSCYGEYGRIPVPKRNDSGSAARYFKQLPFDPETIASIYYQAKASKRDRSCNGQVNNVHPTVKSRYLLEYFIKLITPPNGIVLDCFGGSGTTAIAAIENGFNYILIEKEDEYFEIIQQRIAATLKTAEPTLEERVQWLETQVQAQGSKIKKLELKNQQLSLFG